MLIVSRGYYSLTYLFSYLLLSRCYRVTTQSVVNKEAKSLALALALRVVALTFFYIYCITGFLLVLSLIV